MRLSPALYVRQWLAKLHPPIPQTPRESQQLLQILEGSFRKHLDELHPSPVQRQIPDTAHYDISLASTNSSSTATHHHFNALLNNPLLAQPNDQNRSKNSLAASAVSLFETASNRGDVTIPIVRRCAMNYLQGVRNGEKVAEKDSFAQKLASWIFTTTYPMREAFFGSTEVLDLAVQIAGVDGQEAVAWDWLRLVYERKFGLPDTIQERNLQDRKWLLVEDVLVSYLMRMSIRRGDLSDAAQQFVEASRYRSASGRAASCTDDISTSLKYVPLENSWKRLVAATIHYRTRHNIPDAQFDKVVSYGMSWDLVPQFSIPVAQVYHPTSPSALFLSQNLRKQESAGHFLSKQVGASKKFRRAMLLMILDGAQLSLTQGFKNDAQFLLDFARTHYIEYLPANPSQTTSSLDIQISDAQGELEAHAHNFAFT